MPLQNNAAKINLFFVISAFLSLFVQGNAQTHGDSHKHNHSHEPDAPVNEITLGTGISYSSEYQSFDPAFHLHAVKGLTSFWGIGAGYELILTEELHQSISVMASFYPIPHVEFSIGPGIGIPAHGESWNLGIHTEASVTWPIGNLFHAGPMFEYGWSSHGYHLSTGLHIGLDL